MIQQRISSGINGFDELIYGGFVTESSILVRGAPGTGKTTFALQYLLEGVKHNQAGLFVSFEQFPNLLYRDAAMLGLDLKYYENTHLFHTIFTSPEVFYASLTTDDNPILRLIRERKIVRVVVDSITHFTQYISDSPTLRETYTSVVNALRREGVTAMYLGEEVRTDFTHEEKGRLSFIIDNIIMLRYLEIDSAIRRAIIVLKMRASDHDKRFFYYTIQAGTEAAGLHIGAAIEGKSGLLNALSQKMLISTVRNSSY